MHVGMLPLTLGVLAVSSQIAAQSARMSDTTIVMAIVVAAAPTDSICGLDCSIVLVDPRVRGRRSVVQEREPPIITFLEEFEPSRSPGGPAVILRAFRPDSLGGDTVGYRVMLEPGAARSLNVRVQIFFRGYQHGEIHAIAIKRRGQWLLKSFYILSI